MTGWMLPVLLGLVSLSWYLLVYTTLKRRTALVLPLGALCGALSPLIGCSLAGGSVPDFRALTLAGLLFVWQIPYFLLRFTVPDILPESVSAIENACTAVQDDNICPNNRLTFY